MFKPKTILMLGFWLILIPFLGIPVNWRSFLLYATGFVLIASYFLVKKEKNIPTNENIPQ